MATAFRLLDLGLFRIGGEHYAEDNGSFGLATIQKRHVTVEGDRVVFEYPAKSGLERHVAVADPDVRDAVRTLRSRRGGGTELLAYQNGRRWCDIKSSDINDYLRDVIGGEVSAKDFRTWHGTVVAALALAERADAATSAPPARRRAVKAAMTDVAAVLGNTPTVARSSYVDARVIDAFEAGRTVDVPTRRRRRTDDTADRDAAERAVQALLGE